MKRKLLCLLMTSAVIAAATLTGCGGGGTTPPQQGQAAVKSATVTFSANLGGSQGAVKSLIPAGTQAIEVYSGLPYMQGGSQVQPTLLTTLTVAAPTATIQMAPGNYNIYAVAYDSTNAASRKALGSAATGGTVVAGANTVELTFMGGTWTLSAPIELSNGTVLKDVVIIPENIGQPMYKKSAFNPAIPYGFGFGQVQYRFTNHTTASVSGQMFSQFNGAAKPYSSLAASEYNITRKCSSYDSYSSCRNRRGDSIILIPGDMATDNISESSYGGVKQGNPYDLLPKSTFTQNGAAIDPTTFVKNTTITNGTTISGNLLELKVTADTNRTIVTTGAAAAKSAALGVKAAQSANTSIPGISNAWFEPIVYNPTGGTRKGGWTFYSTGTTSDGKTYYSGGYLQPTYSFNPTTGLPIYTYDPGDYSYGLVPTDSSRLGEYCAQYNYATKTCTQVAPNAGDIYYPWNFWDLNGDGAVDYGSFTFRFYLRETDSFDVYNYSFTATGK